MSRGHNSTSLALLVALLLTASLMIASGKIYFQEEFTDGWENRWVQSKARDNYGEFKLAEGKWYGDAEADKGIQTSQNARHYAISALTNEVFDNQDKDLILQYSIKNEQSIDCGGGYIKLLPKSLDQEQFNGDSKYYIMFGPDICGYSTRKVHLIFHYNGKNLDWKKTLPCSLDTLTHVYTLILHPDNTYEVQIDGQKKESGSLVEDWAFLAPKTIPDPNAKKPEDWADDEMTVDPEDKKPDDWDDEAETIPDSDAQKPDNWDDDEDGVWERPMIPNPKFKGPWNARMIPNPAYKGPWKAPEIPNPDFVEDNTLYHFSDSGALGFEIWQVKSGTIFDNIILADNLDEVKEFSAKTNHTAKEKEMFDEMEKKKRQEDEERRKKHEEERKKHEEEEKAKREEEEKKQKEEKKEDDTAAEEVKPEEVKPEEVKQETKPASEHDEL